MSSNNRANLRCRLCLCLCHPQELVAIVFADLHGPLQTFAQELLTAQVSPEEYNNVEANMRIFVVGCIRKYPSLLQLLCYVEYDAGLSKHLFES